MRNVMTYKGYIARIEFDSRDNIFIGKVLGIEDSITFHGTTVKELRVDFEAAITTISLTVQPQGASHLRQLLASSCSAFLLKPMPRLLL